MDSTAASLTVPVEVKSAWYSKINWTQAVAIAASGAVLLGVDVDAQTQASIVMAIQGAQGIVTWVLRTWFNRSVSPASL